MPRKGFCLALILGALSNIACEPDPDGRAASRSRPHVIIYLVDTLRPDHLGAYGYLRQTSPALDAFAREATLFTHAYAQASWTRPSVGSLFTGRFPSGHGAVRRENSLRRDVPTLAEILKQLGYRTAGFITNPNILPIFGFERGFDEIIDFKPYTSAETLHTAVLEYLVDRPEGPHFLYIHSMDPHAPYKPPDSFQRRFSGESGLTWQALAPVLADRERSTSRIPLQTVRSAITLYDEAVAYADQQLGRLFEALAEAGIYDDAIIIVLSDHGEEFGEHGGWLHGDTLFQEQLLVPLIIRLPNKDGAGRRVDAPVRVIDLLPTLAEYLAAPIPAELDGRSFLPTLLGHSDDPFDPVLYAEENLDGNVLSSLVDGRFKLIKQLGGAGSARPSATVELFDLAEDPGEQRNLAAERPSITARLMRELVSLESRLRWGTYLELTNAEALTELHRIRGTIEVIGGSFASWELSDLEAEDRVEIDAEWKRITLALILRNDENPQRPPAIVRLTDVDRIHFRLDPPDAAYRLDLWREDAGGKPIDLMLGASESVATQRAPLELRTSDPRIVLETTGRREPMKRPAPYCRIYTVPDIRSPDVDIDAELDRRLRAIGYVGDEE